VPGLSARRSFWFPGHGKSCRIGAAASRPCWF